MAKPDISMLIRAAENADWEQVVLLTGGPPCFHLQEFTQTFCLRSRQWPGHERSAAGAHAFVSLADLLRMRE